MILGEQQFLSLLLSLLVVDNLEIESFPSILIGNCLKILEVQFL